tara:strand:+ start:873 stop:1610 length:738 start_codon:yes stop_codon:yes gene_type:complete
MSFKARGLETLVGAGFGSGAGALAGRLSYSPDGPTEWQDEEGHVRSRRLSDEERQDRRRRTSQGALVGAGLGSAVSLGGSAFRRAGISKAERSASAGVGETYLSPLRGIIKKDQTSYDRLARTPAGHGGRAAGQLKKRIDSAVRLLGKQEKEVSSLLGTASSKMSAKPYGGRTWSMRNGEKVPFYEGSHQTLVSEHFDQLAKAQGYKGFSMANRLDILEDAISSGMKKTAAEAFRRELRAILGGI